MSYENSSYHKKWWVKTIRERNFFGFRYWWFNWVVWTLGCFLLLYGIFFQTEQDESSCLNRNNLTRRIHRIDEQMEKCCSCNVPPPPISPIDTIDTITPPPPPPNSRNCNSQTRSGNDGVDEKNYILGTNSGMVTIQYDMATEPDKLEVFYENHRVASTFSIPGNSNGYVGGGNSSGARGQLQFYYKFNREQYVTVRLTGGSGTSWNYTVDCPK